MRGRGDRAGMGTRVFFFQAEDNPYLPGWACPPSRQSSQPGCPMNGGSLAARYSSPTHLWFSVFPADSQCQKGEHSEKAKKPKSRARSLKRKGKKEHEKLKLIPEQRRESIWEGVLTLRKRWFNEVSEECIPIFRKELQMWTGLQVKSNKIFFLLFLLSVSPFFYARGNKPLF